MMVVEKRGNNDDQTKGNLMNKTAEAVKPFKQVCPPAKKPQPFPTKGVFNLDLRKADLEDRIGEHQGKVRSYKMTSIYLDDQGHQFEHWGSGPNFQGGLLTLCSCAHQIRAEKKDPNEWLEDWWLAGFTIPKQCGHTWLFYLAQVEQVYSTAADLWTALPTQTRTAKSTRRNRLGDAYQPSPASSCADPFDAAHYYTPVVGHSHHLNQADDNWKKDIEFYNSKFKRHASYLVANSDLTFLWQTPTMFLKDHPRNKTWKSVAKLLSKLEESSSVWRVNRE